MGLFVGGWIILGIACITLYGRFLSIYQATYNVWRPRNIPWVPNPSLRWSLEQFRATFRSDGNPKVEKARRVCLAVWALAFLYLVVGFPLASWLLSN